MPEPILTFPEVIDNTMRVDFVTDPRKFYWAHIRGYRLDTPNIHLHFGACFARGIEVARKLYYGEAVSVDKAVAQAAIAIIVEWGDFPSEFGAQKSLDSCVACLVAYFEHWKLDEDPAQPWKWHGDMPAVEFSFNVPIPELIHPVTGLPLRYVGRFDAIMQHQAYPDLLLGEDEKTSGQMGAKWAEKWRLRSQFMGYQWGANMSGVPIQGMLIRGITPMKTEIKFNEAIKMFARWEIDRWYVQMVRDFTRAIDCWNINYWDMNMGDGCTAFGGCPYLRLCESPDPEQWLSPYYKYEPWNPLLGRLKDPKRQLENANPEGVMLA